MPDQQDCKPIEVLMIEDNPGDIRLAQEGLKRGKVVNNLRVAEDGETGLAMLRKEGEYAGSVRPDLILLDLNLPGMEGREVLAEIKSDPDLEHIPVIILTSSEAEEDILKTYKLKASSYITKPVEFHKFMDAMKMLDDYWLAFVKLPPNEER